MKAIFRSLHESEDVDRWVIFIRAMTGVWYNRELPQLDDGAMVKFVTDYARRRGLHCALALLDRWTLWIDNTGSITRIEKRIPGAKNRPYMQADDDLAPFVWISDLSPADER